EPGEPGVVDQHADLARVGGQALDAIGVAEVGRGEPRPPAGHLDLLDGPGAAAGVPAVHDDLEAVAGQGDRDGAAQARGRARARVVHCGHYSFWPAVSAAASMSRTTSSGWETMATWLDGTSTVTAPIR